MTCYTGQVFCLVWSSVGARIGLQCAGAHMHRQDSRWRARPRLSTHLLHRISEEISCVWWLAARVVGVSEIGLNWTGNWLNYYFWTGNWLNYYFWTESNWNSSLNWIIELTFGLELGLRCYTFIFILSSYVWMWFEIFVVHFDWCVNWRYFLTWKRKGKELTQEEK